jgi:hypothetical protein
MGLLIGLVICGAVPATAQTTEQLAAQIEKESLWVSNYRDVIVRISVQDDSKLGITEDDVRTKVELRLRQAGIRPHPTVEFKNGTLFPEAWVLVQVSTIESAFWLRIDVGRHVSWPLPNDSPAGQLAFLWSTPGRLGIHGHNRAGILSLVGDEMDTFLNAYLKANQ